MVRAEPSGTLRVAVVDADHRVRGCLRELLDLDERVNVTGCVGNPAAAMDLVAATSPHVVVVDPHLPELDAGLDLVVRLRASFPQVRILLLGWTDALDAARPRSQAHGVLDKTDQPDDLVAGILRAASEAV